MENNVIMKNEEATTMKKVKTQKETEHIVEDFVNGKEVKVKLVDSMEINEENVDMFDKRLHEEFKAGK